MGHANGMGRGMPPPFVLEFEVPTACIGRLIGKGGARIHEISKTSGARLNVRENLAPE